jgi:hypothetical protein
MFEHMSLFFEFAFLQHQRSPRKNAFIMNAPEAGSIVITLALGFTITILQ